VRSHPALMCTAQVWDVQREALHPIRAGERAADLIDIDDQKATIEVPRMHRFVLAMHADALLITATRTLAPVTSTPRLSAQLHALWRLPDGQSNRAALLMVAGYCAAEVAHAVDERAHGGADSGESAQTGQVARP